MGGYFSTRWRAEHTRQHTDPLLKLDIRWLHRIGGLQPGAIASPSWSSRGTQTGMITTIMQRDRPCLVLDYRTQRPGEAWQPVRETVWLDTTPCHYGGSRSWFLCPGCHTRRAVLFSLGGRFRCRVCHDLAYTSTREDDLERALRRCAELRRMIGGDFGQPVWTIPPKPDGMTWRRYDRIVRRLTQEINRATGVLDARLDDLSSDLDRVLNQRKAWGR